MHLVGYIIYICASVYGSYTPTYIPDYSNTQVLVRTEPLGYPTTPRTTSTPNCLSAAWDCWLRISASVLYTWRSSAPSEVIKGPIKTAYKELYLEFSNSKLLRPKLSYTVSKLGKRRRPVVRRFSVSIKTLLRIGWQFMLCFVSLTFVECLENMDSLRSLSKRRRPEHFLTNMHSSGWRTYLCFALQL